MRDLDALIAVYATPLKDQIRASKTPIITEKEFKIVFSNVEKLAQVHRNFLAHKLQAVKNALTRLGNESTENALGEAGKMLANAFMEVAQSFRQYQLYVGTYEARLQILKSLEKKNKKWPAFLKKARTNPKSRALGLHSFLIMPVQRIPRYIMLLEGMKARATTGMVSRVPLERALLALQEVMKEVDSSANRGKAEEVVRSIYASFDPPIMKLSPKNRRLLAETVVSATLQEKSQPTTDVVLFIFNDSMIFAEPINAKTMKARMGFSPRPHQTYKLFAQPISMIASNFHCTLDSRLAMIDISNVIKFQASLSDAVKTGGSVVTRTQEIYSLITSSALEMRRVVWTARKSMPPPPSSIVSSPPYTAGGGGGGGGRRRKTVARRPVLST